MPASERIVCDGCGKPRRFDTARNELIALKRCSRCRSSWYHDGECQKRHYKVHKVTCCHLQKNNPITESKNDVAIVNQNTISDNGRNELAEMLYSVRKRPDGEHGLFACQTIESSSTITCLPLAPPILMKSYRTSNCAFCFRSIAGIRKLISLCNNARYPVYARKNAEFKAKHGYLKRPKLYKIC